MAIEINSETNVSPSSSLYFSAYVTLSDTEQIILDVEELQHTWNNGQSTITKTGKVSKYRLEQLVYSSSRGSEDEQVCLSSLRVRGFRKDGGLRFRDETIWDYELIDSLVKQIPDKYHDYAREAHKEEMKKLQIQLTNLTNNGVKIGN